MSNVALESARAEHDADRGGASETVRQFVIRLLERYRAWGQAAQPQALDRPALDDRLISLELAEAGLRLASAAGRPAQVAVLGPTQTGKSTVVNALLGMTVAEVSPLAGFTVQAHGFASGCEIEGAPWIDSLFPGWPRSAVQTRDPESLNGFSIANVNGDVLTDCVLWDTPDFDSLASHAYRRGVVEIAALADVIVLVMSKEKYADLSVWRMLRLIRPLGRRLILVVNKLNDDARDAVVNSLRERLGELDGDLRDVTIVPLAHRAEIRAGDAAIAGPDVDLLRAAVRDELITRPGSDRSRLRSAGVRKLVRAHWPQWTAPIVAERAAQFDWDTLVRSCVADAHEAYRRDYLEHPQRYDSFRRATVELLALLELPGVGNALTQVRRVVTWPARQLWTAGRALFQSRNSAAHHAGAEELIMTDLIERVLTALERDAFRRTDAVTTGGAMWPALAARLQHDGPQLRAKFRAAGEEVRARFGPEVHRAATQLYEQIKSKPVLLNSLRAVRATTDAASIVLAVKTAGLHANDLLLAPAMFAITSLLAEGALGSYMHSVADELRRKQSQHVWNAFFSGAMAETLLRLPGGLDDDRLFGVSSEQCEAAEQSLREWEGQSDA